MLVFTYSTFFNIIAHGHLPHFFFIFTLLLPPSSCSLAAFLFDTQACDHFPAFSMFYSVQLSRLRSLARFCKYLLLDTCAHLPRFQSISTLLLHLDRFCLISSLLVMTCVFSISQIVLTCRASGRSLSSHSVPTLFVAFVSLKRSSSPVHRRPEMLHPLIMDRKILPHPL